MNKQDAELSEWLTSMGVAQQFSSQDIESGKTVVSILHAIDRECKVQLQEGSSAINRVSNWNAIMDYLKHLGIKLNQQEKGKIINGNHDLVFRVISKLRETYQRSAKETEINLKDIDVKKQVKDADSLLQLFLLAIMKNFSLSPKEALSLLSNDGKYLAHILAKGLKNDFRPIDALILELSKNLSKISFFSKNKQNELFFLKSIKPSLISKSQSVAENSLNLITGFLSGYQKEAKTSMLREYLIPTFVLIIRRHSQLADKVIETTLQLTDFNQDVLNDLYQNTSKGDLSTLFVSLWRVYFQADKTANLLKTPIFAKLIEYINAGFKDPDLSLNCLGCALQLASTDFQSFQKYCGDKLVDSIRQIVFSKQAQNITLIHIFFSLLDITGSQKHALAPVLYKLLYARLPNAGDPEYDVLMLGFQQLFIDLPSIPSTPVIESLSQRPQMKIGQLQLALYAKISAVASQARVGVSIYNIVSRSFVEQIGMGRQLATLLVDIVGMYKEEDILLDMTAKLIKVCLALYFANVKKLAQKRKPLSLKVKLDGEQAATKLKMLEIQYLLRKVVELGEKSLIANVQPLLCFSYVQLLPLGKQHYRGLQSVLSLLGDPAKLIARYEQQLGSDPSKNKSRLKNQSPTQSNEHQQGNTTEQASELTKSAEKKRSASSHPLHPMSLSLVGVKQDAYLGLQKYAKRHQVKAMAVESKRYQIIQVEEDKSKLKKMYQKKMVLEKGFKYRGVSENQLNYLFQFDSKEVYAQSNQLYLNSYTAQAQEQRDAQGVQQYMRRYEKAMRVYYNIYCGKKTGVQTKNFDQHLEKAHYIHSSAIFKLLKDHGLQNFITPKQIRVLARRVNYKLNLIKDDPQLLDFDGFKQFIIQMAFTMYTRPPKDLRGRPVTEMLDQLFSTLKLYASQNRVSAQLFNEPQACFAGEEETVKLLNRRLQQNPDYILPQGYKKVTQTRVFFDHKIYLSAMSPTYKEAFEVLDEIIFDKFKFHIVQPFTREQKLSWARPNIYALQRNKLNQIQTKHLPMSLKKQVAKFPIMERAIAKDAALAMADIIQAIELNHQQIGLKHQNPLVKSKRQQQEELRRAKEAAQQKRKNLERQLKTSMQAYKQTKQQKLQKTQMVKQEELEKKKQKEQRRQKRQKQLKQKLEQFNEKKKQDQQARKASEQSRIQKEKQEAQRKKKQLQENKRKIQQLKKQKQEQQKQQKQRQKQEEKKRKQEERRRFQRSQKQKKQKIQEFKQKKKKVGDTSKVMDAPGNQEHNQENP